jgi:hypothetical protein
LAEAMVVPVAKATTLIAAMTDPAVSFMQNPLLPKSPEE